MNSWRLFFAIIIICFILMPQNVLAQRHVAIEVSHSGDDSVGSRLAYLIKEGIRRSAGLRIASNDKSRLIIHLVTMDEFRESPGTATIYSYTITFYSFGGTEIYLTSGVGSSGTLRVNESAEGLIAKLDREADGLRKALKN